MADLRSLIREDLPGLTALRRELHACPELAYDEHRTSERVARELASLPVTVRRGMAGGTGLIAHLPATTAVSGACIGLRADMDALPIEERTGKPYASTRPGIMHACGHDGHTTILLGAARALSRLSHRPNAVTFIFQPAEEGGAGGERMCADGALRGAGGGGLGPLVSRIFGLHGWPAMELGVIGSRPGPILASTHDFFVTVRGVQAHAAYPHLGRDPILAGAHVVTALQSIASREVSPLDSVVVTVGQFHAGTANNVIPGEARISGTVRTLRPETRRLGTERIERIVASVAEAFACRAEVQWRDGYPVTLNDPAATERFFAAAREAAGPDRARLMPEPSMGGEDFSFYAQHIPACFFLLGLCPPGAPAYPSLHQPDFDFNDEAIPLGAEMMCRLALQD